MIQINLCRISADGSFLEFSVECPNAYYFQDLSVVNIIEGKTFDLSSLFKDKDDNIKLQSKYVVRIPVEYLGLAPSMYQVTFTINTKQEDIVVDSCDTELTKTAYCSDVSSVYNYIIGELLPLLCSRCITEIPIEIQRVFTFLYAHIWAMKQGDIDSAQQFFDILIKKFRKCPIQSCGRAVGSIRPSITDCGCHRK